MKLLAPRVAVPLDFVQLKGGRALPKFFVHFSQTVYIGSIWGWRRRGRPLPKFFGRLGLKKVVKVVQVVQIRGRGGGVKVIWTKSKRTATATFFRVSVPYTNHSASHIPDYVTPAVHSHRRRHSVTSVSHSGETLAQRRCHTLHSSWPSVTLCTEVACQALASSDCRKPISHLSCSLAGRKSDTRTLITYTGTFLACIVQRTMGRTSIPIPRYHQK